MRLAPIAVSTYSRLHHLKQTIEALQKNTLAKASELYIFSDAPKLGDEEKVKKVRNYIHTIDGFKNVNIVERATNGRVNNGRGGIRELLEKYGRTIFMEDDNVTAPGFLQFMNDGLNFYKDYKNILSVSGHTPNLNYFTSSSHDVYLSKRFHGWGVGFWYEKFILINDIPSWPEMLQDKKTLKNLRDMGSDMLSMIQHEADRKLDALDLKACYLCAKYDCANVLPTKTLVKNIGMDGSGVHCSNIDIFSKDSLSEKTIFNMISDIKIDNGALKEYELFFSRRLSIPSCSRTDQNSITNKAVASLNKQQVQEMMNLSARLLNSGKAVEAMRVAEKAASFGINVSGMQYLRCCCLNVVGRHEEALEAAKAELAINPNHPKAQTQVEHLTKALTKSKRLKIPTNQRPWNTSIRRETLLSIQNAAHNYAYKGVPMIKNPFDFALYPILIWDQKPRTIIEIGSKDGGSALWFGDMLDNYGIPGHVYSIDIVKVTKVTHLRVTFIEGDGRALYKTLTSDFINSLPRPFLVIEDADHSFETSKHVLDFFHPYLKAGEFIVIEDGIISDLSQDASYSSGPHRALKKFLLENNQEYEIDGYYCDFFGYNFTWCTNGFLKKVKRHKIIEYPINESIPSPLTAEFHKNDSENNKIDSQMSQNERFQLYYAIREFLFAKSSPLRFVEIGSWAGASLLLIHSAMKQLAPNVQGFSIEPGGQPQFYEVLRHLGNEVLHLRMFSHQAAPHLKQLFEKDGIFPEFMFIDGSHKYEDVRQDIIYYFPLLAPGGLMVFHDYLPQLNDENREVILFHHGGSEPGIRCACHELMENTYHCEVIDIPLLYPTDPTQTQARLPIIPGVFSTIRAYRKP